MTGYGTWCIYFNRHQEAPRVWCVAPFNRHWEVCVRHVVINTSAFSVYDPSVKPDPDRNGMPSAYLMVSGWLSIDAEGTARITDTNMNANLTTR